MANVVNNYLTVKGPNPLITKLKNKAQYDPKNTEWIESMGYKSANNSLFSFACLYPVPALLLEEERSYFKSTQGFPRQDTNAEKWRYSHWGTDWDVFDVVEKGDQSEQWEIRFTSRWTPPMEAIQKISGDFPGLTFELGYWSCDSGFQGDTVFSGGGCLLDERDIWAPEEYMDIARSLPKSEVHPFVYGNLLKQSNTN